MQTATIFELPAINFDVAPDVTAFGCTTGNITDVASVTVNPANVSGGSGTYVRAVFTYTPTSGAVETQDGANFTFSTTNASGGNVTVDVYDDEGCMASTTVTIEAFNALSSPSVRVDKAIDCRTLPAGGEEITVSVDLTSPLVLGENINFTITDSGGTSLTNTVFGPTVGTTISTSFTGLGEDIYDISIMNLSTGCISTIGHQVNAVPSFNLDLNKDSNVVCIGDNNGSITFDFATSTPYGGSYDYEVFNSGGATTGITGSVPLGGPTTINTLGAGTYYVEVTMTASPFCPVISPEVIIEEPAAALSVGFTTTPISCISSTSGAVDIGANGGWGSYEYQLENITTGTTVQAFSPISIVNNLTAGDYLITVSDANGCSTTANFSLVAPLPIAATPVLSSTIACQGDETATIRVDAVSGGGQGAPAVYSYSLTYPNGTVSAIQSSNEFTGLGAGTYEVNVYDEFSCNGTFPITINEPSDVTAVASVTSIITCLTPEATIEVTGNGGTGVYMYSMDGINFVPSNSFSVPAGDHEFYVRDANNCVSDPYLVSVPALVPLTAVLDTISGFITCTGDSNATLSATASGGLGNYMYELLDGAGGVIAGPQASNTFDDIGPGMYSIRVTSQDCVATTATYEVVDPPLLEASEIVANVSCNGGTDGSITINATGGTGAYVYEISTEPGRFQTSNEFTNLTAGTYSVMVQDERGCFVILDITITEPPLLEVAIDLTTVQQQLCVEDTAPSFEVTITGGTAPYSTSLNGGAFVDGRTLFDNLTAGETYVVIVRDSNGCTSVSAPITLEPSVSLEFANTLTYDCVGAATITGTVATIHASNVVYTLSGPENASNDTGIFNVTTPGIYTLEVEHVNGCMRTITDIEVETIQPLQLVIDDSQINRLIAIASGGIPPYEYSIDGGDFSSENEFIITQTRDYIIVVRDSRGCEQSITVEGVYITVEVPNLFTPDGDGIQDYWYPDQVQTYHELKVFIFDRYGRELGTYNGIQQGWDGTYQGRPMPSGDYWYTLEFTELSGERRRIMGHFTLYR
ncbi:hypothetical protein TAMYLO_460001 [Tenacibaculum amylolyticum]